MKFNLTKVGITLVVIFAMVGVIKIGVRVVRIATGQEARIPATSWSASGGMDQAAETRTIVVEPFRYKPDMVVLNAGTPYQLRFVTNNVYSCIRALAIPALGIREYLPATGEKIIPISPLDPGRYEFMCSMGMYRGTILVN